MGKKNTLDYATLPYIDEKKGVDYNALPDIEEQKDTAIPTAQSKNGEVPTVELTDEVVGRDAGGVTNDIAEVKINGNIVNRLEEQTKEKFSNPLFDNPKARESYYQRLEEKGYGDVREVGERFINAKNSIGGLIEQSQQNPTPELEYQTATALSDLGKYQDAASIYSKLITDGANSSEVYQGMARVQYKLGNKKAANKFSQMAQQLTTPEIASIDKPNPNQARLGMIVGALEQFTPAYSQAKNLVEGSKHALETMKSSIDVFKNTQGTPDMKVGAAALRAASGAASGVINYAMNSTPIGLGFVEATQGFTGQGVGQVLSKATGERVTPEEAVGFLGAPITTGISTYERKSGNKVGDATKDAAMLGELLLVGWAGHKISQGLEGKVSKESIATAQETAQKIIKGESVPVEELRQLNEVIYKDKAFRESVVNPYNIKAHEASIKADKIAKAMQDAPATVEILMPEMEKALEEQKVNEEKAIEHDAKPAEEAAQEAHLVDQREQLIGSLELVPEELRPTIEKEIAKIDEQLPKVIVDKLEIQSPTGGGFTDALKKLGYEDADIAKMTFEQQQDIVINKREAPVVESSAKVDAVKENAKQEKIAELQKSLDEPVPELKIGDTVELPPQIEGAAPRVLQYTENGWMQSVGGELTNISEGVKKQANEKFKAEEPVAPKEEVKPVEVAEDVPRETIKEETKSDTKTDAFKELVHKNIESDEVKLTLSNIERETGRELSKEDKEYNAIKLKEALAHGTEVVEKAKEEFGDDYATKLLDYLDENKKTLSTGQKSLIQIALELDLERRIQESPDNALTLEKQLKLVRDKTLSEQRSAAQAIGYGRLRQIARVGYDINQVTDQFFSPKEREGKAKVEKAIQATAEEIQKEAEKKATNEAEVEFTDKEAKKKKREAKIKKADAQIAEGVDELAAALGWTQRAIGDARPSPVKALQKIGDGLIKKGEATIENVYDKIKEQVKNKFGRDLPDEYRKEVESGLKKVKTVAEKNIERLEKELEDVRSGKIKIKEVREKTAREKELREQINDAKEDLGLYENKELPKQPKSELEKHANDLQNRIDRLQKELEDLREGKTKEAKVKAEDAPEITKLKEEIRKTKEDLGLVESKGVPKKPLNELEKSALKESKKLEGLENKLADLIQGKVKEAAEKAEDSPQAKELKEKIQQAKENLGIVKGKRLPKTPPSDLEKSIARKEKQLQDIHDGKTKFKTEREKTEYEKQLDEEIYQAKFEKGLIEGKELDKEKSASEIVKQHLIDEGFGKEIKVKGETKTILDWRKLAGEEGSVEKLKETVAKSLEKEGYTLDEIAEIQKGLESEYHDLRASIIEKALNELNARNKENTVETKSSARKLAELYNLGLFEKEATTYDNLVNKALGLSDVGQKNFAEAKKLAQSLNELFTTKTSGRTISELGVKEATRVINKKIEELLSKVAWEQSNGAFKAATMAREYMGLAQRNMLVTLKQFIENPFSGFIQRAFTKLGFSFDKINTKELIKNRRAIAKAIYEDTVRNGGLTYGDTSTPFLSQSKVIDWIDKQSDSQVYHTMTSAMIGRAFLDGADSMHKASLTERYFTYNLIKVLTDPSNPKRMSKADAINYVSENLTGQSLEAARTTAKEIIEKVNGKAGKDVLPTNKHFVERLANNIVKDALVQDKKLSLKEIESSYDAAYKAAGFDLGHEANNPISSGISKLTSSIESDIKKSIKEKKWNEAAALTFASIFSRNILNPFVGGGTNWVTLTLQKSGLDLVSPLFDYARKKSNPLDVTSEAGIKNMENALMRNLKSKNTNTRVLAGAAASLLTYAAFRGTGADKDINEWLKKNEWAKKYFNVLSPQALVFMLYSENKELGKYFASLLNMRTDAFSDSKKLVSSIDNIAKGNAEKGTGQLGSVVGGKTSLPLVPYMLARDVQNVWRGIDGKSQIKHDYDSKGFIEGYYQQGIVDYISSLGNPEHGENNTEMSAFEINNKFKGDKEKITQALIDNLDEVKKVDKKEKYTTPAGYEATRTARDPQTGKNITVELTPEQTQELKAAQEKAVRAFMKDYERAWTNAQFESKYESVVAKAKRDYLTKQKLK